jgi:predicted hydrocarbon binding protein
MVFVPLEYFIGETVRVLKSRDFDEMMKLYFDAWKAGVLFMKKFVQGFKVTNFADRYNLAMEIISMAGFGDYKTLKFDTNNFAYFEITNNPVAEDLYPSKVPVDFILRGFNAGGGSPVHERIINTIETECKAVNGKKCVHINASTDSLSKYSDKSLVKDQLNLRWLLPKQIEFIKNNRLTSMVKIRDDLDIRRLKDL